MVRNVLGIKGTLLAAAEGTEQRHIQISAQDSHRFILRCGKRRELADSSSAAARALGRKTAGKLLQSSGKAALRRNTFPTRKDAQTPRLTIATS
eukprot:6175681-Pleurochrysis_carterae.AAC.2